MQRFNVHSKASLLV